MAGHECDTCGTQLGVCDALVREYGDGCCDACFTHDSHGLLERGDSQEIANLNRLAAQTVIARSEHAMAIRTLQAEVDRISAALARIEGRLDREEPGEKKRLLQEVMTEVRTAVHSLPERVKELEDVAVGLERHLKIVRRPKEKRSK